MSSMAPPQNAKVSRRQVVKAGSALQAPRSSFTDRRSGRLGDLTWRHEFKYVISRHVRTALMADLRALMAADRHADCDGTYVVRSLYLESPDWTCFREKTAGEARRHKLRIRTYMDGESEASPIKFEIKYRKNERISKRVATVSRTEYRALLPILQAWRMPDEAFGCSSSPLRAFFTLKQVHALAPALNVQFRRQAFTARSDSSVRVTFDDHLVVQRAQDLLEPMDAARPALGAMHSVLEIKVERRLPHWLQFLIRKYHLRSESVSKFCNAALATPFSLDIHV